MPSKRKRLEGRPVERHGRAGGMLIDVSLTKALTEARRQLQGRTFFQPLDVAAKT